MFVVSDEFDLKRISRFREFEWRENLLCGVTITGSSWPGPEAAARFMLEAARRCGLAEKMQYVTYAPAGRVGTRPITLKSFERLGRGELVGARAATGVVLRGVAPAVGAEGGAVFIGGEVAKFWRLTSPPSPESRNESFAPFLGVFLFPLDIDPINKTRDIFRFSVEELNNEYGYFFVCDDLNCPDTYHHGYGAPLDWSTHSRSSKTERANWFDYARNGLWSDNPPRLRDLYQINLLSELHTANPVEGLGRLPEWISAQPGRGQLEDIGRGRMLWTLSDAEIFNVRPILNAAGLLLSCRGRVYRDLPGGLTPAQRADVFPPYR